MTSKVGWLACCSLPLALAALHLLCHLLTNCIGIASAGLSACMIPCSHFRQVPMHACHSAHACSAHACTALHAQHKQQTVVPKYWYKHCKRSICAQINLGSLPSAAGAMSCLTRCKTLAEIALLPLQATFPLPCKQ